MTTAIATQAQTNWDFLDEGSTQRSEFLKFKQGQYFCKGLTGDKEVDLTGSLFVAAMPTYRQTLTAWTDDSVAPVEQHMAYLALGQRLPAQRTDYPQRSNGMSAWQDGFAIDGMLMVAGEWHQAAFNTGSVTANIAFRQAMQGVKQAMGRTYHPDNWSPVWELGKYGEVKVATGSMVKIPNLELQGLVNKDLEVAAALPGLTDLADTLAGLKGRVPCDPATTAPFMLPSIDEPPARPMGSNTGAMLASGIAVPQSAGAGGSVSNDINDDIPF